MSSKTTDFGKKIAAAFAAAALLSGLTAGVAKYVWPQHERNKALAEEKAKLEARIAEKEREIEECKTMQRRFGADREFVESLARRNKRVYPDELVFVFAD